MKCLRCFKRKVASGSIYCNYCMDHFPQCKNQKKYVETTTTIKTYLEQELKAKLSEVKKIRKMIEQL